MENIVLKVVGTKANAEYNGELTSGSVGIPVVIQYDESWSELSKFASFRVGSFQRTRENVGENTTVPWEVMRYPGKILEIGVEGRDSTGGIVIPTVWASVKTIKQGANKSIPAAAGSPTSGGNSSDGGISVETDPTVPAWAKQPEKPEYTAQEVGAVATVNGIHPDENGNVKITIPDSSQNSVGLSNTAKTLLITILRNGAYGTDQSANITALEAELASSGGSGGGEVEPGEPVPPVWAQVFSIIGELEKLDTENRENLVAAINEVLSKAGTGGGNVDLSGYATEEWVKQYVKDSGGNVSLNTAQINALDGMFKVCAFSEDAGNAYKAFKAAFVIKELSSISATYSGGSVAAGTALTDLTGIVVTANYSDGTTATVTGYTLSGAIAEGANTVTVSYGGLTTTITVMGVAEGGEEVTLSSISAEYTGGEVATGTALSALTGLVVTGTYSDGSTSAITGYTLSGEIAEGENTITVSYGGLTTIFAVTGYVAFVDEEWTQNVDAVWTAGALSASTGESDGNTTSTQANTDFIEIPEGANAFKYEGMSGLLICYFDADKTFLSSVTATYSGGGTYGSICTDENGDEWSALHNRNAKFIRLGMHKNYQPSTVTFKHLIELTEDATPRIGQLYSYTLGDDFGVYVGDASPYANCNGMEYLNIRPVQRRQFIFYDHNHSVLSTVNPVNNAGNNVAIPSGACYFRCGSQMYQRMLVKFADAELTTW